MTEIDFDINKYFNNLRLLLKTTHFTRTNVTGTDLLGRVVKTMVPWYPYYNNNNNIIII